MDKIIDKIAALGVPGLVLLMTMHLVGFAGAAAMTAALATLGGPFGMLGGIAVLILLALIAKAIADYGFREIYIGVVSRLKARGLSRDEVIRQIENMPISRSLKDKLIAYVRAHWDDL